MAYVSKQWKDRQVEYPNRRTITHDDLTQEVVSVNRNEGTIYEAGDVLDSVNMNNLESRIAAGLNEKQNTLTAGQGITIENDVISATGGGGGASALVDLTDTDINSPTDKQALVYDATTQKWKNGSSAGFALEKTASGSVVSFNDGADDLPVKSCVVSFMASQASGTPAPENPLPITLVSSVSTTRTGKNLWVDDATKYIKPFDYYLCPIVLKSGYRYRASARLKSGKTALSGYDVGFVASGDRYVDFTNRNYILTTGGSANEVTVLIDSTWTAPKLIIYLPSGGSIADIFDAYEIQMELGRDTTTYEPYNGTTYTSALSAPSAGGWKDMASGDEGGTHNYRTLDETGAWAVYAGGNGYSIQIPDMASGSFYSDPKTMCDIFPKSNSSSVSGIRVGVDNNYIYVINANDIEGVSSLQTWKAWLQNNPIHLTYPLATPTTASGTGNNITTLKGQNVVFSDVGDTDLTYQTEQASDIIDLVGEGGASDLADLGDVDLTTPTDGQVLTYDATAEKWVNEDAVGTHVVVEKTVLGSVPVKPSSISTLTVTDAMGTDCVKVKQYLECAQIDAPRYDPPREDLGTIQAVSFAHLRHIHNGTTDTYNTSFSTSFFGGEYDFISGTVKVTLDAMSIQTCTMHNTYPSLFAKAIDSKFVQSISAFIKSSIYTLTKGVLQLNAVKDHEIIIYNGDWNGTTRLWAVWKDTRFTTNSQMTTWLADDHQITLVGLLQTPYYLQATAHAIALDEGENTFESYDMLEFGARIELTYISDDAESIIDEFQAQTGIEDLNDTQILNPSNNQALLYDSTSGTWQNKAVPVPWVEVTGNLSVGSTSITLSDDSITTDSTIDIYTDPELPHTAISVTTGSVTITFEAQQTIIAVKVRVS